MLHYRPLAVASLCYLFAVGANHSHATITEVGDVSVGADVRVGIQSVGTLAVEAPSALVSDRLTVGVGPLSYGAVRLNGTTWDNTGNTIIGDQGRGVFRIEGGGIYTNGQDFVVGSRASGDVSVSGFGTALASQGALRIGESGSGRFTVSDGGYVSSGWTTIGSQQELLSSTIATVTGSGSFWDTGQSLWLGETGLASLRIQDGGVVQSGDVDVARSALGAGEVEIDGPGSLWEVGSLDMGIEGRGDVVVRNGGSLLSSAISLGFWSYPSGSVIVDGENSYLRTDQGLSLGNGDFIVRNGGTAVTSVGLNGLGRVVIDGATSRLTSSGLFVDTQYGQLTVSNGGTLEVTSEVLNTPEGTEVLLSQGNVLLAPLGRQGRNWNNSGTIRGSGRVLGTLWNQGQVIVGAGEELNVEQGLKNGGSPNASNPGIVSVVGGRLETGGRWNNLENGLFTIRDGTLVVRGFASSSFFASQGNETGAILVIENSDLQFSQTEFNGFFNFGEVRFTGGVSRFSSGLFNNSGVVSLESQSQVTFEGPVLSNEIISVADGSSAAFLGDYEGSEFAGDGELSFHGRLHPGQSHGPFSLGGAAEFTSTSQPHVQVSPNENSVATEYLVEGPAELGGELTVGASQPVGLPGETIEAVVLNAETINGEFDITPSVGSHLGSGVMFNGLTYDTENGVVVMSLTQAMEADFNLDNVVDDADMAIWGANFGDRFASFVEGDADFDRDVDLADLMILQRVMGASSAAVAAVPEPGAGLMVVAAPLHCVGRRRRRA